MNHAGGAAISVPMRKEPEENPAASMSVTGINQLWSADITYVRPENEFV